MNLQGEAKHTPGPWVADPDGFVRKRLNEFTSVHIATIYGARRPHSRDANTRLIAAAPELLAALIEASSVLRAAIGALHRHGLQVPLQWLANEKDMHQAIAKAEGR
jgi:hypothetical protein